MALLLLGDCYELLARVPDGSVKLLLTDPPYGISRPTFRHTMGRQGCDFGEWDVADHTWVKLVRPKLAPGANVVIWHDVWKLGEVRAELEEIGAKTQRTLAWYKSNPNPGNRDRTCTQTLELAAWFSMPGEPWTFHRNPSKGYENGVYHASVPRLKVKLRHPTQKPVPVLCDIIKMLSDPGDLVLDPFGGSGTTALAAHKLGRDWVVIEKEMDYYAEAQARLGRIGAMLPDPALEGFC